MRGLWLLAALPPALAACAAAPAPEPTAAPAPVLLAAAPAPAPEPPPPSAPRLAEADLFGRWQIVSLNGRPPLGAAGDPAGERTPHIVFGPGSYGGSAGCNAFGGFGLFDGVRYYASGAGMTAMACSELMAQENAVVGIMTGSPRIVPEEGRTLSLIAAGATMVLRRTADLPRAVARAEPPETIAGTSWTITHVDGVWLERRNVEKPTLRFEADRWTLTGGGCGERGGAWRQRGDRIEAETPAIVARACPADAWSLDERLLAMLAASPRFVTGPNGEILIGGGDHWAIGWRERKALADDAPLLAGSWRIVALDGAEPLREPGIAFGPSGFSGSTGCNLMQGHYLAHARRVFAAPPMRTEIGCPGPLRTQEERIASLLTAAPRIALAGEGEIALVDSAGSLRLRREAGTAPSSPAGRPWTGTPLPAELTMLGSTPLQARYSDPATRLRLSAQRWDIETGCGRLGGVWRREEAGAIGFFTDAEPDPRGACAGALAARLRDFRRLFNGRARILIGESGELLIAGEESFLAGRVVRTPR
ncbi:MAG TPA: META domain-containing protein [Allosphingosinicella sp.]|nr:META domain-containing protein [Allosphingosinicella sp.]